MRIGEAASALGTTTRALRYYEQRGLLSTVRSQSGQREFDDADLRRLRAVRELLESGLTISDVRLLLDIADDLPDYPIPPTDSEQAECPFPNVARQRLADLDERINRLTTVRSLLAAQLEARYATLVSELVADTPDDAVHAPTADTSDRITHQRTPGTCIGTHRQVDSA